MSINKPGLVESVAEEVRSLIARKKINQADVADAIQRSQSYVSRRLQGLGAFDIRDIERLSRLFEVEPSALLGWAGMEVPKAGLGIQRLRLVDNESVGGSDDDLSTLSEEDIKSQFDNAATSDESAGEAEPEAP